MGGKAGVFLRGDSIITSV